MMALRRDDFPEPLSPIMPTQDCLATLAVNGVMMVLCPCATLKLCSVSMFESRGGCGVWELVMAVGLLVLSCLLCI